MKANRFRVGYLLAVFLSACFAYNETAQAALTTNSWSVSVGGRWEAGANWSEGAPSITQAVVFLSNIEVGQPAITTTIDGTTVGSFPATMTISNLVIGDATIITSHQLVVSNTGTVTPLRILNSLMVTNRGSVYLTNSTLRVDGPSTNTSSKGAVAIEGSVTLDNGSTLFAQTTTNSIAFGEAVGLNGSGTLIIVGGTNVVGSSSLVLGENINSFGSILITGGALLVTNTVDGFASGIDIGNNGSGSLTQSNGFVKALAESMGRGTLTVAAGTHLTGNLDIDGGFKATGTVWVTGGELLATNGVSATTVLGTDTSGSSGILTVSNGIFATTALILGFNAGDAGTLTVAGGAALVSSNVTLGNGACTASGNVIVDGGNLFVTNAAHNATLEIRDGTFALASGTANIDRIVVTNACAHFVRTGGTLVYGTAVLNPIDDTDGDGFSNQEESQAGSDPLDPNSTPLRITSIVRQGNNVLLTWTTRGGKTNVVQAAMGSAGGSYSNDFTDLSPIIIPTGSGVTSTNYIDVAGATNGPARYYRIRLVP